jgi:hypothetical protein
MKAYKLLLAMIGGWLLFIGFDSINGKIGLKGASKLAKPLQIAFFTTKAVRTIIMFLLAVETLFVVAHHAKEEKRLYQNNS